MFTKLKFLEIIMVFSGSTVGADKGMENSGKNFDGVKNDGHNDKLKGGIKGKGYKGDDFRSDKDVGEDLDHNMVNGDECHDKDEDKFDGDDE